MCLAIPSKVVELRAGTATVECFGIRRDVSLLLLEDGVAVGDYLLVRAGGYACERVDEAQALEVLELMAGLEPIEAHGRRDMDRSGSREIPAVEVRGT